MLFKVASALFVLGLILASLAVAQQPLSGWITISSRQNAMGEWCFSLHPVEEEASTKPDTSAVCGKAALEQKLLTLPSGSAAITWVRQGTKLSLRNLGNPPHDLVEEVSRFALNHGIGVERRQFGHVTSSSPTGFLRKSNTPPTARTLRPFLALAPTMTISDVVQKCGVPDEDIGSGVAIFLYHLEDGSTVSIGAVNDNPITGVAHIDRSGKVTDLLAMSKSSPRRR